MNKPRGWRQMKTRSLPIIRKVMDETGDWNEAMKTVQAILLPQFGELPDEILIKAWWDESNVGRTQTTVRRQSDFTIEKRVAELEMVVATLLKRIDKLESGSS